MCHGVNGLHSLRGCFASGEDTTAGSKWESGDVEGQGMWRSGLEGGMVFHRTMEWFGVEGTPPPSQPCPTWPEHLQGWAATASGRIWARIRVWQMESAVSGRERLQFPNPDTARQKGTKMTGNPESGKKENDTGGD